MILDIIFFVIIIAFAALGFIFGFFKTLVSFCGWFVSMLIAYLLAKAIANAIISENTAQWLIGEGSLFDKVYGIVPDGLKEISLQTVRDWYGQGMSVEKVQELVSEQSYGVVFFISGILKDAVGKEIYLKSALQNVGQVLALELTYDIYVILVGVALFIVFRVIIMGLSILLKGRFVHGPLKLLGRILGLALGLIRGFAYACLIFMVAGFASGISETINKQVTESQVSVPVTTWISEATSKMLSGGNENDEKYQILIDSLGERLNDE